MFSRFSRFLSHFICLLWLIFLFFLSALFYFAMCVRDSNVPLARWTKTLDVSFSFLSASTPVFQTSNITHALRGISCASLLILPRLFSSSKNLRTLTILDFSFGFLPQFVLLMFYYIYIYLHLRKMRKISMKEEQKKGSLLTKFSECWLMKIDLNLWINEVIRADLWRIVPWSQRKLLAQVCL